jgi:hypothetical protein
MHVFDIYKNEIAYYMNFKCASRTMLGWAAIINKPTIYNEHPEWFEQSRRSIEYIDIRPRMKMYENPTHDQKIRFCIVRDPIERFVSAFTNRILYHRKPRSHISISDFILNIDNILEQDEYIDTRIHFRTQTYYIGEDTSIYTHIFGINEMNRIKNMLEDHTKIYLPDIHLQKSGKCVKPTLTAEEKSVLKKRYHIDYEIYGKYMN